MTIQAQERLKTQHQITGVTINNFSLFKIEVLSVNVSRTKTDVFIAIVLVVFADSY